MKKLILLLLLAAVGVLAWYFLVTKKKPENETPKPQPLAVSKHSDSFNVSVNNMLETYYALSNDFVKWDSAAVRSRATALSAKLGQVNFKEMQKDTAIYVTAVSYIDILKAESEKIAQTPDPIERRRSFHTLSQSLYDLMRTIRYDKAKIYLQECPMAFNDEEPGNWLSKTDAVRNPYLGLHHPKYGKGMLECGAPKDTLNFTQP